MLLCNWNDCKQRSIHFVFSRVEHVKYTHSSVSFCDGLFYDNSLLWPLWSRTERSRLVVHRCHNSSIFPLLSAHLTLMCLCFFSFFYFSEGLLSWSWFFRPSKRQTRRESQNVWHYIFSWCLLKHGLALLQQNKKWFDWYFFNHLCNFLYT